MPKKNIIDLNESSPKKKVKRSSAPKKTKAKIFSDAPGEHYFVLCNGQTIKSIKELADTLESVEDSVFFHHVNAERNDFATWVKDIFSEEALANELSGVADKGNTRIIIYRYLLNSATKGM